MAKKCCGKWKKKGKFCSSCPASKEVRAKLVEGLNIKKGKKVKKAKKKKKK